MSRVVTNRDHRLLALVLGAVLVATACADSGDDNSGADGDVGPDAAGAYDGALHDATSSGIDADPSGGFDANGDALGTVPCGLPAPTEVVEVSVGDLHQRIADGEPLAVVDVREPSETAGGVIEGALLYPWTSGVLTAEHETLPDDVPLFVICRSGARSAPASQFLFDSGHNCVHNVLGGMNAWTGAGYPTVTP